MIVNCFIITSIRLSQSIRPSVTFAVLRQDLVFFAQDVEVNLFVFKNLKLDWRG